ncbi:sensor histidine kinase [Occallatibacter riparius]|uniref:histidine kinase n=1 Tax=Occallatibacter riparius TaxID=1002689 RepID=A0A9J7BS45_9BACT|nr:ATP-binding protein [Occallatibacter riparius]UWZ85399.1 ATP-binding protein [Occallatibacter riparius]
MDLLYNPDKGKARWTAFGIVAFFVLLAVLAIVVPGSDVSAHNILHHLNFLPLMIAGMLFGVRGALATAVLGGLINAPVIAHQWRRWPLDAKDQILEFSIFVIAGLIAGYLSDREREHRRKLEQTRQQLEDVYRELSENVERMKQAERMSATGRLAASLAHEIRNPLASISGAAGILRRGAAPAEYLEDSLDIIQKESQRLNKLLTGFLNFAKPRLPRLQHTEPDSIVVSVASLASHAAQERRITIEHQPLALSPEIDCDPEQLRQVLLNLVLNAIEASPADSRIILRTICEDRHICLDVEDCGIGIPDDMAERIFDPFFTTKPKGTGLGLAISSTIIAQHGGTLTFHKNARGGTTFRIQFPLGQEASHAS